MNNVYKDDSSKVIEGRDGWLFLGNDTNNSIEQYTGKLLLSDEQITSYSAYFAKLNSYISCDFSFFVVPNKEYVLPDKYPYFKEKSSYLTILEQVKKVAAFNDIDINYPVELLSEFPESFYKTDTHWNDYGAYLGLEFVLKKIDSIILPKIDINNFDSVLVSGDLGEKLNPVRKDSRLVYTGEGFSEMVFHSNLKNHGYVVHYKSTKALNKKKVLIFGDSFGIQFEKFLEIIFEEVVFAYSPAIFIKELYDVFCPDVVILQINQRFLAEPPKIRSEMKNSLIFKKINKFSANELLEYKNNMAVRCQNSDIGKLFLNNLEDKDS